ncbi:MAG: FAD-dependent oxidoreductase, partial [Acetobacteraceae bacterium]|nr:FAD-dependent oxidoreductase [Acetobacteraceae bacterium]
VLRRFALRPEPGVRLTLVAREPETPYSGMLPGVIRGDYTPDQAAIDLAPLAAAAGARLILGEAIALHLDARRVAVVGRPVLPFDLLSLDLGGAPAMPEGSGVPVKPIGRFLAEWAGLEADLPDGAPVAIVGAGPAGVELALALAQRCAGRLRLTLVASGTEPLDETPARVRSVVRAALVEAGVALVSGVIATHHAAGRLFLSDGTFLEAQAALWASGVVGPIFLAASGLGCDALGCVQVDACLRSVSHDFVFAAGDCAALAEPRPKAGVWAVRAGPPLAANLRRAATGRPLQRWHPQREALAILGLGHGRAVAWRNGLAVAGAAVWHWKDRLDRRWVRTYATLRPAPGSAMPDLAADRATDPTPAAIVKPPVGKLLIQALERVPALVDDPFALGRLATVHALAALHAAGAQPSGAMAFATLPTGSTERDLTTLLDGVETALRADGATLLRANAAQGSELSLLLAVNGWADSGRMRHRSGLQAEDVLILTKPLGASVLLAGHRLGRTRASWLQAALETAQASDAPAARVLTAQHASACASLTSQGLLGALTEMLAASGMAATLRLDAIPLLPGALDVAPHRDQALAAMLSGPAIAAGLLAGVAAIRALACLEALAAAGVTGAIIGAVEPAQPGTPSIRWEAT